MIVGGAFLTTAVLFSFASGIFHPYYVSLLAPFTALLVGAGAAQLASGRAWARVAAPLAVACRRRGGADSARSTTPGSCAGSSRS